MPVEDAELEAVDFDPFNAPVDGDEAQNTLIAGLQRARGFGLFFAVTNSASERNQRMDAVSAELPDKKIQRVAVNTETENLLWHLRETLTEPRPDAVLVYGLENWVSGAVPPRSIPFLINLNAARDSFQDTLGVPMVLWVPQYVLKAIMEAAPDFFSVRSGVFTFPLSPDERNKIGRTLTGTGAIWTVGETSSKNLSAIIQESEGLLAELRSSPDEQQKTRAELMVIRSLAAYLHADARPTEAELYYKKAIELTRQIVGDTHPDIAALMSNLAATYISQKRHDEAEKILLDAITIGRNQDTNSNLALSLNELGQLYRLKSRYDEAERLFLEAIAIERKRGTFENKALLRSWGLNFAHIVGNLGDLYRKQGRYIEAETPLREAVAIYCAILVNHPNTAAALSSLAALCCDQNRFTEAHKLYKQALDIERKTLRRNHPNSLVTLHELAGCCFMLERFDEAVNLCSEAMQIGSTVFATGSTDLAALSQNYKLAVSKAEASRAVKRLPVAAFAMQKRKKQKR